MKRTIGDKLVEALRKLRIKDPSSHKMEICGRSEPVDAQNHKLYKAVNELLLSIVEARSPGECNYVTGEMQVLRGRRFRLACRRAYEKHGTRFRITGHIPGDEIPELHRRMLDGDEKVKRELLKWWHDEWGKLPWIDYLDCLYICASRSPIDLYALPDRPTPHFLVFGNEYVLLQEEHAPGRPKRMWILRSESLANTLTQQATETRKRGASLSYALKQKLSSINSLPSLRFLFLLSDEKRVDKSTLNRRSGIGAHSSWRTLADDLQAIGFIQESEKCFQITRFGERYSQFVLSVGEAVTYAK